MLLRLVLQLRPCLQAPVGTYPISPGPGVTTHASIANGSEGVSSHNRPRSILPLQTGGEHLRGLYDSTCIEMHSRSSALFASTLSNKMPKMLTIASLSRTHGVGSNVCIVIFLAPPGLELVFYTAFSSRASWLLRLS